MSARMYGRGVDRVVLDEPPQRHQRGVRLEQIGALRELLVDDVAQRHQPAAFQQFVGQRHRVADTRAQHGDRDPDAEHAEPVQQRRAGRGVDRQCGCPRGRTGPPTASPWSARPASTPASFSSATNSLCRSVRAVSASSPDTGTTAWQMPVLSISAVNRVATSLADSIASMRPAPISSARDATPMTPSAPGRPADQLADLLEQRDVGGVEGAQQEHHRVDARARRPRGPAGAACARRRRATATTSPGCR